MQIKWRKILLIILLGYANCYADATNESEPALANSESAANQADFSAKKPNNLIMLDNNHSHYGNLSYDPYENFNRNAYRMNDALDRHFVRPTTVWYIKNVPFVVRTGVQDFFNNLRDFVTLGNDILQLNTFRSMKDTARVCVNSTIGILGVVDVASMIGLPEHVNTFGHTMRFYGWENSSYYVIPFLGPSTIRDALGIIPDTFFNPTWWIDYPYSNYVSVGLFAVNGIDQRSKYLGVDQTLDTSLDPYSTVRDFYMQSSGNVIIESATTGSGDNDILLQE